MCFCLCTFDSVCRQEKIYNPLSESLKNANSVKWHVIVNTFISLLFVYTLWRDVKALRLQNNSDLKVNKKGKNNKAFIIFANKLVSFIYTENFL